MSFYFLSNCRICPSEANSQVINKRSEALGGVSIMEKYWRDAGWDVAALTLFQMRAVAQRAIREEPLT